MADDVIVSRIRKNAASEIWIVLKTYQGKPLCDIREYFLPDGSPDWLPTKKGVSIPRELLPVVIDFVEELSTSSDIRLVGEIERGKKAKICIAVREFNKHVYGEIRTFFQAENGIEEWKPGKGVTLPLSKLAPLVEGLRMAEDCNQPIS